MPGVVLLMLPLSVLLVCTLAVLAFADVAFRELRLSSDQPSRGGCAPTSNPLQAAYLSSTLQRLTQEQPRSSVVQSCACESFVPTVTEPEARSIAEELRQRGGDELNRVMERSRISGQSCPMLTATGLCGCAISRPLSCLGRCVVGGDSPEWVAGVGDAVSQAFRQHLRTRHVNADVCRLDEALVSLLDRPASNTV